MMLSEWLVKFYMYTFLAVAESKRKEKLLNITFLVGNFSHN